MNRKGVEMRGKKRLATWIAALSAAAAIGGAASSAFSTTQAGFTTSPGRHLAGVSTSPGTRELAARKAGRPSDEYFVLAIPGVRGTGGGAG